MRKTITTRMLVVALLATVLLSLAGPTLAASLTKAIDVTYRDIRLVVDGAVITPKDANENVVEPFIYNGTTYLPVRAVGEAMGKNVQWDSGSSTVYVGGENRLSGTFAAQYLQENLRIMPLSGTPRMGAFIAAMEDILKAAGDDRKPFGDYTALAMTTRNIAAVAVVGAGLEELALTFPAEKTAGILAGFNMTGQETYAAYVACAIVSGLIPGQYLPMLAADEEAALEQANVLLLRVADYNGLTRGFVGNISDDDIIEKLNYAWNATPKVASAALEELGGKALADGLVTGYNLRDELYRDHFLNSVSLAYGHADMKHARQLLGLLQSEGVDARVTLIPKTSAYEYMLEWGDPTGNDSVKPITEDRFAAYDKEYDLLFEFVTKDMKNRFDEVILAYAKKETSGQPGLIAGSWFQPLYASKAAMDSGDFKEVVNHIVSLSDGKLLTTYGLKEDSADIVAGFEAMGADMVTTERVYVNAAFYRYLTGESSR